MHQDNPVSVWHMSSCYTYLQIEGWILPRVTLSLLGIQYVLMDSLNSISSISGMDSSYPFKLYPNMHQDNPVSMGCILLCIKSSARLGLDLQISHCSHTKVYHHRVSL